MSYLTILQYSPSEQDNKETILCEAAVFGLAGTDEKISPWICIKCLACDIFLTSKKDDFQFLLLQNDMHFWRFDVK